jgi:hemoglobin
MSNIFKRIGGKDAVNAAVDRFYEYMLTDDRVKDFFDGVNMDKQRQHQKDFFSFALGGEGGYNGKDVRTAHQHLVDNKGLSDVHFDATAENLVKALNDLSVPQDIINEVVDIVAGTRNDVLCR